MTERPRICLIYTGGTIAMVEDSSGSLRPPENPETLLDIEPAIRELAEIDFLALCNKDSANITTRDWTALAEAIYARRHQGYRGFVVTHGTDTMHFTASALAFALGPNLWFPVVLTGAQAPPAARHGDARINLLRACKVAAADIAEVVICFGDYVLRGCRAQKKDERHFDAFESPACPPLAFITESVEVRPFAERRARQTAGGGNQTAGVVPDIQLRAEFAPGVLEVTLIPGLEPGLVCPSLESPLCQGLILRCYGAGNVPNIGLYSFLPVIRRGVELNKPVILTSQFPAAATAQSRYQTGLDAVRAGAISTGNMTHAAAVTKFRWVLAQVLERIRRGELPERDKLTAVEEGMNTTVAGEMD